MWVVTSCRIADCYFVYEGKVSVFIAELYNLMMEAVYFSETLAPVQTGRGVMNRNFNLLRISLTLLIYVGKLIFFPSSLFQVHFSGLIGAPSHPDMQKIRIIGFFFESRLHLHCYLQYVPASKRGAGTAQSV
jgi:hypothetical protein